MQSLVDYAGPGGFDYSLTICFGERRAALGDWKMAYQRYPNAEEIAKRVKVIETIFASDASTQRYRLVNALGIGLHPRWPRERSRFPGSEQRFASDTKHFKRVYGSETVGIYQALS